MVWTEKTSAKQINLECINLITGFLLCQICCITLCLSLLAFTLTQLSHNCEKQDMHNNNYKGPERKLQHHDRLPLTQRLAPRWQMYGLGNAGAAVGLRRVDPVSGKTGLTLTLRFMPTKRPGIQVQRNGFPWGFSQLLGQWTSGSLCTLWSRHWALGCIIGPDSRLETMSRGNVTVCDIQRRLDSPETFLLLQCMLFDFFHVRFLNKSKQGRSNEAVLGTVLMLTSFAITIPCKLMKAPLDTSGNRAGGSACCCIQSCTFI